ncbi:cytidine deaminase family protein [Streptomyces sp. NPDC012623]|uniref:cytidine deaminase family protein n=1 Tax=unclassified Streptomyces TaxID=2593676 RepID=UPI00368EE64F
MTPPVPPPAPSGTSGAPSAAADAASACGTAVDHGLIEAATTTARTHARGDNHTVAAAGRAADGRIVTAMNAYHFTGGPCAELVLVGAAAAQGVYDLTTIVAVGDGNRGLMPPCGRCRQFLFDYFPEIHVIVGTDDHPRTLTIAELLPEAYVWADHQD